MVMLSSHKTVMEVDPGPQGDRINFTNYDPDLEGIDAQRYSEIYVDYHIWQEMGEPEKLTITVEPGDLLNS